MYYAKSIRIVAALFAITSSGVPFARSAEPTPAAYRMELQVVRSPNDHQTDVLSSPTVITHDRQEALVKVAKQAVVAIEGDERVKIESGITCRLTPHRLESGALKLDIETDVALPPDGMPEVGIDYELKKFGTRRVQIVPLGKRVQIPITPRGQFPGYFLSLEVTEVRMAGEADDAVNAGRKLPDAKEFNFFISGGR